MATLTPKQKRFIDEYLCDLNAKQAAIRAGYSERRAGEIGYQLLQKTTIKKEIKKGMDERKERTKVEQDDVVRFLVKVLNTNVKDFIEFNGNKITIKPSDQIDGTLISEAAETQNGVKIKMYDKLKAAEMLGRHLGMFSEKLNVSAEIGSVKKLEDFFK